MPQTKTSLDMLSKALKMEEKGKAFYDQAAEKCSNELGREVFKGLAADEVVHEERIKAIYKSLQENHEWSDEWTKFEPKEHDLNELFKEFAAQHEKEVRAEIGDIEALDVGIDFEQKSIKYYEDHLARAQGDMERSFLERMIDEEKGHYRILTDAKFYLTDPEAWFREKEHLSVDG